MDYIRTIITRFKKFYIEGRVPTVNGVPAYRDRGTLLFATAFIVIVLLLASVSAARLGVPGYAYTAGDKSALNGISETGEITVVSQLTGDEYDGEGGFETFAAKRMMFREDIASSENAEAGAFDFYFEEQVYSAIHYNGEINEAAKAFAVKAVEGSASAMMGMAEKEGKALKGAVLADVNMSDCGNGARCVTVHKLPYQEIGGEMTAIPEVMNVAYLEEQGWNQIIPEQILEDGYRKIASEKAKEYIGSKFKESELVDGWEANVTPESKNFNLFRIDDGIVTFYFNPGNVLDVSEGVLAIEMEDIPIREEVAYRYIDPNKPMVAITFDDGPGGPAEAKILKILKKYNAIATFFYQGSRVKYFKENVVEANELGCEIANHSWDHPEMTGLTNGQIKKQLKKTDNAIEKVTGEKTTLMRPPYGSYNDRTLKAFGKPAIMWSVDTLDWQSRNAKSVFKKVKNVKNLDGHIILMHSLYDSTADATGKIVPWLQKEGYQLVTVSELIEYKTGKAPKAGKAYYKQKKPGKDKKSSKGKKSGKKGKDKKSKKSNKRDKDQKSKDTQKLKSSDKDHKDKKHHKEKDKKEEKK